MDDSVEWVARKISIAARVFFANVALASRQCRTSRPHRSGTLRALIEPATYSISSRHISTWAGRPCHATVALASRQCRTSRWHGVGTQIAPIKPATRSNSIRQLSTWAGRPCHVLLRHTRPPAARHGVAQRKGRPCYNCRIYSCAREAGWFARRTEFSPPISFEIPGACRIGGIFHPIALHQTAQKSAHTGDKRYALVQRILRRS